MHFMILAGLLVLLSLVFLIRRESEKVEFSFYTLPLPHLPPALEGLRIVHISDVHYPFHMEKGLLRKLMDLVNEEKPDLVVLTGDLVSTRMAERMEAPEMLGSIVSRYGIFAVLGNHDYCYGRHELMRKLGQCAITVLKNEHALTGPPGCPIQILGLDDPSTFRDEPEVLFSTPVDACLKIVITHSPGGIKNLLEHKIDLILAGHTHGGQIRLPLLGGMYFPVRSMREYDAGWFRRRDIRIFVNRGLGFAVFPVRFLCPREIAFFTLTASGERIEKKRRRVV